MKSKIHEADVPPLRSLQMLIDKLEFEAKTHQEVLEELKGHGVDTEAFMQRARAAAKKGLEVQYERLDGSAKLQRLKGKFANLAAMSREGLEDLVESVRIGECGEDAQRLVAAYHRGSRRNASAVSDEELRSLLEDIAFVLKL
jgi:hypothetical protein